MLETLQVRPVMQADKEYSALISVPPPLNGLHLFYAPFMMTTNDPEWFNVRILMITYFPLLLLCTCFFIFYNLLMIPICYLKMFFHKMVMIFVYSKSNRISRADKFMLWIVFAILGPFRLFANVIVDTIAFIHHCVKMDLKKTRI